MRKSIKPNQNQPETKKTQVTNMFDGISKNYDLVKAGMLGAACSSEIISHYGGRPEDELKDFIKNKAGLEV